MNLFDNIRKLFGVNGDGDQSTIDRLDEITIEKYQVNEELIKAQSEYDELNQNFSLKISACDKLIEKGFKESELNKQFLTERFDGITDNYFSQIKPLAQKINDLEKSQSDLEINIIAKSIEAVALLDEEKQSQIKDVIEVWSETGLIKGEFIDSQAKAITLAINEVVEIQKGGEGSKGGHVKYSKLDTWRETNYKKHIDRASDMGAEILRQEEANKEIKKSHDSIELAGTGEVIYDSPVKNHYANAIVRRAFKEGDDIVNKILFLKRGKGKTEEGKYCLPGGHIDEGETIEQAARRELKEEANLSSESAYIIGKAKCEDGKWAFYCTIYGQGEVALLDGENSNAHWMSMDEWVEADLFYDLKDHLLAIESREQSIDTIPDIIKSEELEYDELEKGIFEGLRGGHVIGHTKSGKAIYENHNHSSHGRFTHDEHMDAAKLHDSKVEDSKKSNDAKGMSKHLDASVSHRQEASKKYFKENYSDTITSGSRNYIRKSEEENPFFFEKAQFVKNPGKRGGEGSHGGDVIGHTKSGKPIYKRATSPYHASFSKQDHLDAAATHRKRASQTQSDTNKYVYEMWAKTHEGYAKKDGVEKAEEMFINLDDLEIDQELIKASVASIGEIRTWKGVEWTKVAKGKWKQTKRGNGKKGEGEEDKKHTTEQLSAHAENTSSETLNRIAKDTTKPKHIIDSAKRELERRKVDSQKKESVEEKKPVEKEKPKAKKSKGLDYTPSEHLEPHEKKEERKFGKFLGKNFDYARGKYEASNGNILNTDNARELSDYYAQDRSRSVAIHEPASSFIKRLYNSLLKEPAPKGKQDKVLFSSGGTGAGKSVPVTTPIITPNGLQQIGTMKIGDIVFSKDGSETKVVGVFPQGDLDVYKIIFSDGTSALSSDDHLWEVTTRYIRMKQASLKEGSWERKYGRNPDKWICNNSLVTTTKIIRENINKLYAIPISKPLQFSEKSYNIDPYLIGILLGDGGLTSKEGVVFSTKDNELLEWLKKTIPSSCRVAKKSLLDTNCDYAIYGNTPNKNDLIRLLKAEGLLEHNSYTKYIPEHYLFGSIQQRTALLQGLLDTDGGISGNNVIEYSTSSKYLRDGVLWIVQSLGGVAKVTERIPKYTYKGEKRNGALSYRIRIKLPNDILPFRLTRKAALLTDRKYLPYRYIKSVEYVGKQECVCIKVDHSSETFLINDVIVTHNTTGMGEHVATKKEASKAHIIYDTNMNTFSSAKSKIDKALDSGKNISIIHTFRDPTDAFKNGAIPRAQRMEKELGSGRTVPIGVHIATHLGSNETVAKIKEHYSGNPRVSVSVIDNSRGKGKSEIVPIDFLKEKQYIASDLEKELHEHVDKLYEQGQLSEKLYRGFKAKGD